MAKQVLGALLAEGAIIEVRVKGWKAVHYALGSDAGMNLLGAVRTVLAPSARALGVLPISLAIPWGLNVGDFLGHIPLPAKITVEALPPIRLREEFGPEPDVDEVYAHVVRIMQETLEALAAERRFPVIG